MTTTEPKELKLYEITHRATGEKHYSVSDNAQDACQQAGWQPGDCYVVEQKPLYKYDKYERAILLVKIPCHVCPYHYAECVKSDDAECPTRPETPDLEEWLKQVKKARLCTLKGDTLGERDYQKHLKRVPLAEAIEELNPHR